MFSFLFFVIIFVLIVGLIFVLGALNFVFGIFRSIFSFGRRRPSASYNEQGGYASSAPKHKEKPMFDKSDVEDVDYEEIK